MMLCGNESKDTKGTRIQRVSNLGEEMRRQEYFEISWIVY
jgi:hypothetical protein